MDATLPSWVAKYVGIPYRDEGNTIEGCDCWGLYKLVMHEQFGFIVPEYTGRRWAAAVRPREIGPAAAEYASKYPKIETGHERVGDGLLIRICGYPWHVGIVVAPGWMLHAHKGADSCVEPYRHWKWADRIVGIYRCEA